MILLRYLKI